MSMSYAPLHQAHIAQRKTRLASVLDVEEVRGHGERSRLQVLPN